MSKPPASAHRVPPYKRPILILGFLVVLTIVVTVTVWLFMSFGAKDDPTHVTNPGGSAIGQDTDQASDDTTPTLPDEPADKAPQYEGADPNLANSLTGHINYTDIDSETQTLHSVVSIDQYLQSDGQCIYNLKRDGVVVRTASAIAMPDVTTSVCEPFSLSTAGLSGIYQIEITITGDGKQGTITGEVQI